MLCGRYIDHTDEPGRVRICERLEQDGVHHGEHRDSPANGKGEGEDGRGGKTRGRTQPPESVTHVFDPHRDPPVWSPVSAVCWQLAFHSLIPSELGGGGAICSVGVFTSGTNESKNGQLLNGQGSSIPHTI